MQYGLLVVILFLMMIMSIVQPAFMTSGNLLNILKQISVNGMLALGVSFVIMSGGIDLSIGSNVMLATLAAGSIVINHPDEPVYIIFAIVAALAVCTVFGLLNGIFVAFFRMPPFIVTMGFMSIIRGVGYLYCNGQPYVLKAPYYRFIGQGNVLGIPFPALLLVVAIIIFYYLLNWTKFGRYILAVGGNENAALTSGVNTKKTKMLVYGLCGLMGGVGGLILGSRLNAGNPTLGQSYEMDAIAAVVIGGASLDGGIGTMLGTVLGIVTIGLISNALNLLGVSSYLQMVFQGVIILAAVLMDVRTKSLKTA
jgi:ribose/xylose/arabinose/galactoside ABC-type transport system permease subunit